MDFISAANEIIVLLTGLLGLIGTAIGAYYAIKNWKDKIKTLSAQENWQMIMEVADAAMQAAEKSGQGPSEKKNMVIQTVSASAKAAGLNIESFLGQLDDYIDQTIKFVNGMKK